MTSRNTFSKQITKAVWYPLIMKLHWEKVSIGKPVNRKYNKKAFQQDAYRPLVDRIP